jgi:hypothetical protein
MGRINKMTWPHASLILWRATDMFLPTVYSGIDIPRAAGTSIDLTWLSDCFARLCNCSMANLVGGCLFLH